MSNFGKGGVKQAQLLDCTLRDGAYLVNKTFGDKTIRGVIKSLVEAKIDIIEIGFLQNDGFGEGVVVFRTPSDANKYIPQHRKYSKFALMADFSRYNFENLEKYQDHQSIEIIRLCFFKHERYEALRIAKDIVDKGYRVCIQPVDVLGYSDQELLEVILLSNEIKPYLFSIVDTFGSMYLEDLQRIFTLVNHNLYKQCKMGFHSHNNLQMSSALAQYFLKIAQLEREVVIDTTLNGMGRGAGNTPTELIALYMNAKLAYSYQMEAILDSIDIYISGLRSKCDWGYAIPYFITGAYHAHTNNILYLLEKSNISSKDLMNILSMLDAQKRKRYDYNLLENLYLEYMTTKYCMQDDIEKLEAYLKFKDIVILIPGKSLFKQSSKVLSYCEKANSLVISVNFIDKKFKSDFVYMSNIKRYEYWENDLEFQKYPKILLSNIKQEDTKPNNFIIDINRVIKQGWNNLDNSVILLLRLLDMFPINSIGLAGFDGYSLTENYFDEELEVQVSSTKVLQLNQEIKSMFEDYIRTRNSDFPIEFITESQFQK
ncbi:MULTISPECIES: aldolase catalytic domain-containing protein [unclassified Helicobacter]|uniref:aldolase catalytic domain-containing protein n=1 Tax=unclassified Helicobacter TaxID=2593540 RepID=UPI0015F15343|nr:MULTISPECIES: aldolase catalytic domain-containing protein [unclassified Helicobacter]